LLSLFHPAPPPFSATSHTTFRTIEPAAGVDTVHDVLLYAARTHGKKKGFAAREIERTITEEKEVTKTVGGKQTTEKKQWNYFKLKPFEWWTYEEMLANVRQVGSGLRSLGVGGEGETFFNIYGSTSYVKL
jgi:long-chain acyl-CoA synthetase